LRALALHELTRIGLRLRGEGYGLSLEGQAMLNEHDWPGNDAELSAVLLRAALATDGNVVSGDTLRRMLGDEPAVSSGPQRALR
jgi:transcriptional regulator of acetoin/glycerol metabolism